MKSISEDYFVVEACSALPTSKPVPVASNAAIITSMHPAIFIDRDGVIIENRPTYVRSLSEISFFSQALQGLAQASSSPYKFVLVTNQAGVGKGLIPLEIAEEINRRVVAEVEKTGGRIDGVFMCPHKPEDGCNCRKPCPGLLLQAAQALSIDLSKSVIIGDSLTDLRAGRLAGVQRVALVRTGRGSQQAQAPEAIELQPFAVYENLAEALVDLIH